MNTNLSYSEQNSKSNPHQQAGEAEPTYTVSQTDFDLLNDLKSFFATYNLNHRTGSILPEDVELCIKRQEQATAMAANTSLIYHSDGLPLRGAIRYMGEFLMFLYRTRDRIKPRD